jgi:hypothetical protein
LITGKSQSRKSPDSHPEHVSKTVSTSPNIRGGGGSMFKEALGF